MNKTNISMASAAEKTCPPLVAEKRDTRRTEANTLRTMLKDLTRRLDLAMSAEQEDTLSVLPTADGGHTAGGRV